MCGIIAIKSNDVRDLTLVKYLLEESQIRGKHSTGVSYINRAGLTTLKDNIPSKLFVQKYWSSIERDITDYGVVSLVGHTRYSTSGIADTVNAQPIADDKLSIVMNGVVTQSSPDKWENEFGVKCQTTNDTEIAHIKMKQGINPLRLSKSKEDIRFSMAVCSLWDSSRIQFFRNGRRPQYYCTLKGYSEFSIVASTKQIVQRAVDKLSSSIEVKSMTMSDPGKVFELTPSGVVIKDVIVGINVEDWQIWRENA